MGPRPLAAHVSVLPPLRPGAAELPRVRVRRHAARARAERPRAVVRLPRVARPGPGRAFGRRLPPAPAVRRTDALPPAAGRAAARRVSIAAAGRGAGHLRVPER